MGDANFDDVVDVNDLRMLADSYGQSSGVFWRNGDFDGDGDVDSNDLDVLAGYYDRGYSQAMSDFQSLVAIPEPSALWWIAGCPMLIGRRRLVVRS